jgi:hypothetical protein
MCEKVIYDRLCVLFACTVLFCTVLFCSVLNILRIKRKLITILLKKSNVCIIKKKGNVFNNIIITKSPKLFSIKINYINESYIFFLFSPPVFIPLNYIIWFWGMESSGFSPLSTAVRVGNRSDGLQGPAAWPGLS